MGDIRSKFSDIQELIPVDDTNHNKITQKRGVKNHLKIRYTSDLFPCLETLSRLDSTYFFHLQLWSKNMIFDRLFELSWEVIQSSLCY